MGFGAPMGAPRVEVPSMLGTPLGVRAVSYGRRSRRNGVLWEAVCRVLVQVGDHCTGGPMWAKVGRVAPVELVAGPGCSSMPGRSACPACLQLGTRGELPVSGPAEAVASSPWRGEA